MHSSNIIVSKYCGFDSKCCYSSAVNSVMCRSIFSCKITSLCTILVSPNKFHIDTLPYLKMYTIEVVFHKCTQGILVNCHNLLYIVIHWKLLESYAYTTKASVICIYITDYNKDSPYISYTNILKI